MILHKVFGLDLGTTNSTPSVFSSGLSYAPEEARAKTIPSIVADKNGVLIAGALAKNNPQLERIKSIKRSMGKDEKVALAGKEYSPEEISSIIVKHCADILNQQIKKKDNEVYDRVVITVPAYFSIAQKEATRKAGELAGLDVLKLLEEPTAAAIDYTVKNDISSGILMVYDLGGGTFDVSIVEKIENVPVVLATAGNNYLGGDNFDNILAHYFLDYLNNELGYDVKLNLDDPKDKLKYNILLLAAENVKKNLSFEDSYDINLFDVFKDNSGVDLIIDNFTREKFEELISDKILVDSFTECDKALRKFTDSGRDIKEIDAIVLVGGSSKIPFVRKALKEKYVDTGLIKNIVCGDPDLAVGYGAGIVAATLPSLLETEDGAKVEINAPFLLDDSVSLSGKIIRGDIDKVLIKNAKESKIVFPDKNGEFSTELLEADNVSYSFFRQDKLIATTDENIDPLNIIAPTSVMNDTLAIEIVDLERQKIEEYPLVEKGEALPYEATNYFKTNEYSRSRIQLPVREGYKDSYTICINLPDKTPLGTRITIKTVVDEKAHVDLKVLLGDKELSGTIKANHALKINMEEEKKITSDFNDKIERLDENKRDEYLSKQSNIVREINEAKANHDSMHYTDSVGKYEQFVREMPGGGNTMTKEQFDEIFDEVKELLENSIEKDKYSLQKIEDEVYFGKRAIDRGDYEQAEKRYDVLLWLKKRLILLKKPAVFLSDYINFINHYLLERSKSVRETTSNMSLSIKLNNQENDIRIALKESIANRNISELNDKEIRFVLDKLNAPVSALEDTLESVGARDVVESIKKFDGRLSID